MRRCSSIVGVVLVASLLARSVHGQSVHVVDAAGGGDFTSLSAAIAAAVSGDVLLIRPHGSPTGNYGSVAITGKALTLVGDGPTRPRILNLHVRDLVAPAAVTLRHLEIDARTSVFFVHALRVEADGIVFAEDVICRGKNGQPLLGFTSDGEPGVSLDPGARLVLVGSDARGGSGLNGSQPGPFDPVRPPSSGGPALSVGTDALASVWSSTLDGGGGGGAFAPYDARRGGHGIASSGQVLVAASDVAGGATGSFASASVQGSDGLHADAGQALHVASQFAAGNPSTGLAGLGVFAAPGVFVMDLDAAGRRLTVPVLREGEVASIVYQGEVGDLFGVFLAGQPAWVSRPFLDGAFHLSELLGPVILGVVSDPGGEVTIPTLIEDLPLGLEVLAGFAQGYAVDTGGLPHLTSPSALICFDAAF